MSATYTCPRCGRVSYNPHDLAHRYCGACKRFEDEPLHRVAAHPTLMSLATLKAAGIPRANWFLNPYEDWEPAFFQDVADTFHWNDYAAIQTWGNAQEALEEDAAAALEKW
jgi:hypothetical protein